MHESRIQTLKKIKLVKKKEYRMKLLVRWALNAGAVYLAVYLIPGLVPQNDIWWNVNLFHI